MDSSIQRTACGSSSTFSRDRRFRCSLLEAADVNDDGWVGITDPIRIFDYTNRGGPPPMPPFPRFGCDPTP